MNQTLLVHACPHPLRMASVDFPVPIGLTVAEIIERVQPRKELRQRVRVFVGGVEVPQNYWNSVKPKINTIINVKVLPGKGSGKNPIATILSIAVMVAAPYYAPAVATSLGVSTAVAQGILTVAGSLLVSAIAPPSAPKSASAPSTVTDPTVFSISGTQNTARLYQPVGRVLGKVRVYPDLAGNTYTENVGSDQYVRQLVTYGYGKLAISDRKIGETLLTDFSDVELQTNDGADKNSAPNFSLYPSDVIQTELSIALTSSAGWITQTSAVKTVELQCDYIFTAGLYRYDDKGNKLPQSVRLKFAYSPKGANTWTEFADKTVTESLTTAVRGTVKVSVPEGQYDVRCQRVTADTSDSKIRDEVYWSALRSIQSGQPILHKGVAADAFRIKATDQLNGSVNSYNAIAQTVCLDWDKATGTWIERATNNPASLYRLVLQDRALKKPVPDAKLDLQKLQEWHEFCEENGFAFNYNYTSETTVGDVLNDICAAGRAVRHRVDTLYTVVIDRPQNVPKAHITPRNSWGYKYEVQYPDLPHGFRVSFQNEENGYVSDEMFVYDDGYDETNATLFEAITFAGVTNYTQNWKHGREHIATARLQPFRHTFNCDLEILNCQKGDLIRFSHDVILAGLGASRIRSIIYNDDGDIVGVTHDENFAMEAGLLYGVVIRFEEGGEIVLSVENAASESNVLTFLEPLAPDCGIELGNLVQFGERGEETILLVIKSIEMAADLTATVTCLDYAPAIYEASQGAIPPYTTTTSLPPEMKRPLPPVLKAIQSNETVMVKNADGSLQSRMVITLNNPNVGSVEPVLSYRRIGGQDYLPGEIVSSTPTQIIATGMESGLNYDLKIMYRRPNLGFASNIYSLPLLLNGILFEGSIAPPDNVNNFVISTVGDVAVLTWDAVRNIDFSHYELRFTPLTDGVTWGGAQLVKERITGTNYALPFRAGTYLIKSFDLSGTPSDDFTMVQTVSTSITSMNVVEELQESPIFAGTKDNCVVESGTLTLDDLSLLNGIYHFENPVDLGDVYTCRLTSRMVAAGSLLTNTMATWASLADVESLSGASSSDWSAEIQFSTTDDDPLDGGAVWSDWISITTADYRFRGIKFQLVLRTINENVKPVVLEASVTVDMPDRIEDGEDIVVPIGGLYIPFNPPFKRKKAIAVTPQNMGSTDRMSITSQSENGFHLEFFNSSGASISRTADWIAKGYGRGSV